MAADLGRACWRVEAVLRGARAAEPHAQLVRPDAPAEDIRSAGDYLDLAEIDTVCVQAVFPRRKLQPHNRNTGGQQMPGAGIGLLRYGSCDVGDPAYDIAERFVFLSRLVLCRFGDDIFRRR